MASGLDKKYKPCLSMNKDVTHPLIVVYVLFSDFHFCAACLRESNPSFREVAAILFASYSYFIIVLQNLLPKQVYDNYHGNGSRIVYIYHSYKTDTKPHEKSQLTSS